MTKKGVCGTGKAMTWRGAAALPSLVGKVAHAKRVTDELSLRFRNNSVRLNGKTIGSQAASFNGNVV